LTEEGILIGGGITLIGYFSTDGDCFRNITDVTISNNRIFNNTNPDIYVSGINLFQVNNSIISGNSPITQLAFLHLLSGVSQPVPIK